MFKTCCHDKKIFLKLTQSIPFYDGLAGGALWKDFVGTGDAAKGAEYDILEANNAWTEQYITNIHWDGYGKYHKS